MMIIIVGGIGGGKVHPTLIEVIYSSKIITFSCKKFFFQMIVKKTLKILLIKTYLLPKRFSFYEENF